MKRSSRFLMGLTGLGLAATIAIPVFAATPATSDTTMVDPREHLIQALVQRFNLKTSDVQQFFQDQESQHAAELLTQLDTRLATFVTQGKLTEAQKTALVAKAKEAQAKHEEARKLSPEECKKLMDKYRTELETWATQQGIDKQFLGMIMGGPGGGHGGPRGPHPDQNRTNGVGSRGGRFQGMFGQSSVNGNRTAPTGTVSQ